MSKTDDELRKAILKAGTVRYASGSFVQRHYSNGTVSPIEHKTQEIVEIGVNDLMALIAADRSQLLERVLGETDKAIVSNEYTIEVHNYRKRVVDGIRRLQGEG